MYTSRLRLNLNLNLNVLEGRCSSHTSDGVALLGTTRHTTSRTFPTSEHLTSIRHESTNGRFDLQSGRAPVPSLEPIDREQLTQEESDKVSWQAPVRRMLSKNLYKPELSELHGVEKTQELPHWKQAITKKVERKRSERKAAESGAQNKNQNEFAGGSNEKFRRPTWPEATPPPKHDVGMQNIISRAESRRLLNNTKMMPSASRSNPEASGKGEDFVSQYEPETFPNVPRVVQSRNLLRNASHTMLFPWLNSSKTHQIKYKSAMKVTLRPDYLETYECQTSDFVNGLDIMQLWRQDNPEGKEFQNLVNQLITPGEREKILKDQESRLFQEGVYCHIMSNGGALSFLSYAVKYKIVTGEILPVVAMFLDSVPGWTGTTINYLPNFGIDQETMDKWKPIIEWIPKALNDPTLVTIKAARHYIYSESDVVVDAYDIKEHIRQALEVGYRVSQWVAYDAPHVGILKMFKLSYERSIGLLWQRAVELNPPKTDWIQTHHRWQQEESAIRKRLKHQKEVTELEKEKAELEARGEIYIPPKPKKVKLKPIRPPRISRFSSTR